MGADRVRQPSNVIHLDSGKHLVRIQILAEFDVLLELLGQALRERVVSGKGLVSKWR